MLIAIIGNNPSLNEIAAQSIIGHFKGIVDGIEIKGVKDLPNHRRNRQMFGDPVFDSWIITGIETQEDYDAVKAKKAFVIRVIDHSRMGALPFRSSDCNYTISLRVGERYSLQELEAELQEILVKEKLIYPSAENKPSSLVKEGRNFEGMNVEYDHSESANYPLYIGTQDECISLTKRQVLELKHFLNTLNI